MAQGGPAPQLFADGIVSYICAISTDDDFGLADIGQPLSSALQWITKPSMSFQHGGTSSMMFAKYLLNDTITVAITDSNQYLNGFLFMFAIALCHGGTFSAVHFNVAIFTGL